MRIGLFFNHEVEACREVARSIRAAFPDGGVEFCDGDADCDHGEIDAAVSIGGDGTFLMTSRTIKGTGAPLYGVNMGRLGFLAAGEPTAAADDVRRIASGDYEVARRVPLRADISRDGSHSSSVWAFNEIMIVKSFVSRPIALSTFLDGEKLYSFLSDGIIISTPIGSTAYALSAGGPIVHPDVGCVSIVPICPHSLAPRPMLAPGGAEVRIKLDFAYGGAVLSGDGSGNAELASGDEVTVTSDFGAGVGVIRLDGGSYAGVLRSKLNWS